MKVGLDTSVIIRLLCGEPVDMAKVALEWINGLQPKRDKAVVSDLVIAESYYALQHHYQVTKADALMALRKLLASDCIEGLGEALSVLTQDGLERADPGFVDRLIYRQYMKAGIEKMVTFEKAGRKLVNVQVL